MKATDGSLRATSSCGFSLVEVLVAVSITVIVMASVFALLTKGQDGSIRETQIANLNMSTRMGLESIARDLAAAGYKTPGTSAVLWSDGGGITPDEITILYADPDVPTSEPLKCGGAGKEGGGGGPCSTINKSSTLNIDPNTLDPLPTDPEQSYSEGMILFAIEKEDCNGDGQVGIYPFELTQAPTLTGAGGGSALNLNHNPGKSASELNRPGGFNSEVHPDCAVIGRFRVVQYRINPLPPTPNPSLERRDLGAGQPWVPVANNIENLQLRYGTGAGLFDMPPPPKAADSTTWINRVKMTVSGRTESTGLQGASAGVFSPEDTHVRQTFSSMANLRNVSFQASAQMDTETYN
ncbi:MAG: PilW family protein [Acidobacteriota bacterium]